MTWTEVWRRARGARVVLGLVGLALALPTPSSNADETDSFASWGSDPAEVTRAPSAFHVRESPLGETWWLSSTFWGERHQNRPFASSELVSLDFALTPDLSSWLHSINFSAGLLDADSRSRGGENEWWVSASATVGVEDIGLGGTWLTVTPALSYNASANSAWSYAHAELAADLGRGLFEDQLQLYLSLAGSHSLYGLGSLLEAQGRRRDSLVSATLGVGYVAPTIEALSLDLRARVERTWTNEVGEGGAGLGVEFRVDWRY